MFDLLPFVIIFIEVIKFLIKIVEIVIFIRLHLYSLKRKIFTLKIKIMAKIRQGILGGFSGKIANVIGSSWKGIAVMRSKALSVANPNTAPQILQRTAFGKCTQFASLILATLIVPLWNRWSVQMSGYNAFVRANVERFSSLSVWPSKDLTLSTGKLGGGETLEFIAAPLSNQLGATWLADSTESYRLKTDKVYALFLDSTGQILFAGDTGKTREDLMFNIEGSRVIQDNEHVFCFVSFLRADGTLVSTSQSDELIVTQ
jgi:hypothetical protein